MRVLSLVAVLVAVGIPFVGFAAQPTDTYAVAYVTQILSEENETIDGVLQRVQHVQLTIEGGEYAGKIVAIENGVIEGRSDMVLKEGERVAVEILSKPDGTVKVLLKEPYRLYALFWLMAAFVFLSVVIGGWTGILSVAGLAVSIAVLLFFIIPRIVAGGDPLVISFIGAAIIACLSLYAAHGFKRRTSVALLATVVTLLISLVVAIIAVHLTALYGMGSEESLYMQMGPLQHVNLQGLLLGGMLLGCLGVLDDITTAQCAAVDEISKANPSLSAEALRKAGSSVGREHIASLINTLALAYAGASLPLLLLLDVSSDFPLWVTINGEFLAEEIVRTLVGSMALLFAVPISTWLASALLRAAPGSHPMPIAHGHHH